MAGAPVSFLCVEFPHNWVKQERRDMANAIQIPGEQIGFDVMWCFIHKALAGRQYWIIVRCSRLVFTIYN